MASYDPYEREYSRRYVREERREDRDDRFDPREYSRSHVSTRELVPREPRREDSDLSVEEIRRDFPPPSGRDARRTRSSEGGYYYDDPADANYYYDSRYDRDYDRRSRRASSHYDEDRDRKHKSKHKSISNQEKIIAAVAGAALLAGGKEMYDRRDAKNSGHDVNRNLLASAALAGVGALAAYQGAEFYNKQQAKKDQKANLLLQHGRDGINDYYSDDEDGDDRHKKGAKNFLESAIAATGLGAAVKSFAGGGDKDDDRSDARSRRGGSRSRSGSRSRGGGNKIQKAAMASLLAGATEAFRVAREPGGWRGEKAKRILTVAAGAATVDAAQDKDHGKLGLAESVIGGLVGNRLINGSKNDIEEDRKTGRSRSRSRASSRGSGGGKGLAALATAGLGAVGAKKMYDAHRSRSQSRDGSRRRSRSRSVIDRARNSLAELGIGSGANDDERYRQDDYSQRGSSRRSRHRAQYDDDDDDYDDGYQRSSGHRDRYDDDRSYHSSGRRDHSRRRDGRSKYASESDLGDSEEDEKRARRMRGKQLLSAGFATIATVNAAHEVYESMEKRDARHKAVKEGRMTLAEARKLKSKAMIQDLASVGIAAMGVKGALAKINEAKHMTHECKEFRSEKTIRDIRRRERRKRSEQGRSLQRSESLAAPRRRRFADDEDPYYGDDDYDDDYYYRGGEPRYVEDNPYRPPQRASTLPVSSRAR